MSRFYTWYKSKKSYLVIPDKKLPTPQELEKIKLKFERRKLKKKNKLPLLTDKRSKHNAYISDGKITLSPVKSMMQSSRQPTAFKLNSVKRNLGTSYEEAFNPNVSFIRNVKMTGQHVGGGSYMNNSYSEKLTKSAPRGQQTSSQKLAYDLWESNREKQMAVHRSNQLFRN